MRCLKGCFFLRNQKVYNLQHIFIRASHTPIYSILTIHNHSWHTRYAISTALGTGLGNSTFHRKSGECFSKICICNPAMFREQAGKNLLVAKIKSIYVNSFKKRSATAPVGRSQRFLLTELTRRCKRCIFLSFSGHTRPCMCVPSF